MAKGTADHPQEALGWAARDSSGLLSPFNFSRRANGPDDVTIRILYCGICHTDLHQSRNEWGITSYPIVPGHEITGVVTAVGSDVKNFKIGDRAGVGCMVGACHNCEHCEEGNENYCEKYIFTYNSVDSDGSITFGGYSNFIVVHQRYAVHIPENLAMDAAAPLLCAGITVYSPMKFFGMTEPGKRLAVVGLGGLGHMAVKFGKAFGLHVTVISTSPEKETEAKVRLGADDFLLSKDEKQMQKASRRLDYIIDTVAVQHAIFPLLNVLKGNGKMVLVGAPDKPLPLPAFPLIFDSHEITGVVTAVGSDVKNFKIGDRAGVGCMVGACHICEHCEEGNENYCEKYIFTYNSVDSDGLITFGGYSNFIVVHQSPPQALLPW